MTNQPEPLDLDDIEARAGGLYEYATGLDTAWQEEADRLAGTDVPALLAEVRRLRARVTELERPAVEARRDEIRQSYTDLIAAAEEASDYEGAFVVQCRLREREEQWATEDASEAAGAPVAAEQPAGAPESHPDRHSASQAPLRAPDGADIAAADNPTPLRWGLGDVLWGDDDTVTVLLSGPGGEPYWLELDPERAAVLREDLAGPDGARDGAA